MGFVPGTVIGGSYRLERKIAEGGMGEVWIATRGDERVAIKRLLPEAERDHHLVTRFKREALLLGKIQSDHVSRVIEQITDPDFGLLLVMEYVEGESLADVLERKSALSVEETIEIGEGVARAIAELHRANIIHRDLKPENVILRPGPNGERRAVLIDFGLARLLDPAEDQRGKEETLTGITRADMAVGTIPYMAPEQLLSSRDVSGAADVYALGAILYRAASGRNVFGDQEDIDYARQKLHDEAPPLGLSRKDPVAAQLSTIVMRAVRRRPADRYDGIEAMVKDLEAAHRLVRDAGDDVDAPTQHAPVSALLGSAATQLASESWGLAPNSAGFGDAAPPSVRVSAGAQAMRQGPSDSLSAQPVATTLPLLSSSPIADPGPRASMNVAPPPVAPPLGRPPFGSVPEIGRPPFGSVPEIPSSAPTVRAPQPSFPALSTSADIAPKTDAVPRRIALALGLGALAIGFVLGFLTHAAFAG